MKEKTLQFSDKTDSKIIISCNALYCLIRGVFYGK